MSDRASGAFLEATLELVTSLVSSLGSPTPSIRPILKAAQAAFEGADRRLVLDVRDGKLVVNGSTLAEAEGGESERLIEALEKRGLARMEIHQEPTQEGVEALADFLDHPEAKPFLLRRYGILFFEEPSELSEVTEPVPSIPPPKTRDPIEPPIEVIKVPTFKVRPVVATPPPAPSPPPKLPPMPPPPMPSPMPPPPPGAPPPASLPPPPASLIGDLETDPPPPPAPSPEKMSDFHHLTDDLGFDSGSNGGSDD